MPELKTLCNRDCPDACGLVASVEEGRVTRLRGDREHPITRGVLCYRTSLFLKTQYSPDRLTSPLLRREGQLRPASWDEALDFIAERLLAIRRESGPAAILHYRSGGSLGLLKHLSDYFFERFGPVTVKRGGICNGAGEAAQVKDFGRSDSSDLHGLLEARNVILWGKNVLVSSPHTAQLLIEARRRGARLALVDPVHQRTASLCEVFHQPRPGGDFALAMAAARLLFERGWVAPDAASCCDGLDEFRALAHRKPVTDWCAQAGLGPEAAEDLAARLGPGKPTTILAGWGMARRTHGGALIRALDALGAISGNVGVRGGGVSYYFARRSAFDTSFVKGRQVAPRTVCEPTLSRDVLEAADPPLRAVWVTCANPVTMLPDSMTTARALASRELVVVVDSFLTDTARCATVVLPTTTLLEADDLLGSYGHHYLGASRPVVAPPPGVRSDLEIIQALAARVGLSEAMAGDARSWKERLVAPKLVPAGVTLEALERSAVRNPLAPAVLFEGRRFPTPSGRADLVTEEPPAEEPTPEFPLFLMALSTDESQSSQWVTSLEGPLPVTVHPESAAGFADGEEAWLESSLAAMRVRVRHDPRQRKEVALAPKGGELHAGRCTNALVRPRLTDLGEGGALYEERVRLVPAPSAPVAVLPHVPLS